MVAEDRGSRSRSGTCRLFISTLSDSLPASQVKLSWRAATNATGWQAHSVRGFLSGSLRKKMGLNVASTKAEDGERSYSIEG